MQARPRPAVFALFALLLLGAACGGPPQSGDGSGRGVLIIAIDGLRADHVGAYGYDRDTTPTLDGLARNGVRFAQAFATAPALLPSHVSLMTGCDPNVARRAHLVDEMDASPEERWRVPTDIPHLAVELLVGGFVTAAFVDDEHLSPSFGFAPGFQRYVSTDEERYTPLDEMGLAANGERFLEWLRSLHRSKPWLAYVHTHDLERVWRRPDLESEGAFQPRPELGKIPPVGSSDDVFFAIPRSRWRGTARTLGYYEALYDGRLRKIDGQIARLLQELEVRGRLDNTTVIVVGTHGVQFGEAGLVLSSGRYSTADVQVPWILSTPSLSAELRDREVEGVASLLDVAPTVLDLMNLTPPRGMHGRSQRAALFEPDAPPARRHAFSTCGVQGGGAVFGERWTLEFTEAASTPRQSSWFGDVRDHAGEERDLFYDRWTTPYPSLHGDDGGAEPPAEVARALKEAGATWDFNMKRTRRILQAGTLRFDPRKDLDTIRELKDLGYLGDAF